MVRPRMVRYPRRMALRRVVLEGEPRERETYVAKAAPLRLEMGVREFEVATRLLYVVARAQPYKLSPALYYNSTRIDVDTAQ